MRTPSRWRSKNQQKWQIKNEEKPGYLNFKSIHLIGKSISQDQNPTFFEPGVMSITLLRHPLATEFNNLSSPFAFTSCCAGQSILAGGRYIAHCANNSAY